MCAAIGCMPSFLLRGTNNMQANKTVKINGQLYDAVTGLPVTAKKEATTPAEAKSARTKTAASSVHAAPQRSQTLHRRATKKPGPAKRPQPGRHMDISRSKNVARFAPHPVVTEAPVESVIPDVPAATHPVAKRATAKVATKKQKAVTASPKQIKDAAIAAALTKPKTTKKEAAAKKPRKKLFRRSRKFTVLVALAFVLLGAALLTYVNLPSITVAFASAQSGIAARYPKYVPDGYGLSQPVTFSDGKVTLKFTAHSGTGEYSITQEKSTWDSSAVLENVVRKESGDNYITTQERGLTYYSFDGNAAWVNGGVLYTIMSDAPLSTDQIRRIATSL